MIKTRITELFKIKYPIIQAGMVWCSGWELASAVSNSGGLGVIGSGSMYPDVLDSHVVKCKKATKNNFAVNIPLLYPNIENHIDTVIRNKVPIVFTSAGNPSIWTKKLKNHGIIVVHVVSNLKFALKSQEAGVDAIVAEGFEAGGHNGLNESTTFCLLPFLKKKISVPLIAAGGIGTGKTMLAAMSLGADGVQMGSRFVLSNESSAHINFKNAVINAKDGDTSLTLKEITPVRMIKNKLYDKIHNAYMNKKDTEDLKNILGKGRAKKGMFEGDLDEGELEIGQISMYLQSIKSAKDIVDEIIQDFYNTRNKLNEY
ncbi:MAG: nitronate monooxygenase [Flavobacteriales bacterium]|nr:nitronate monooxygenase [Flavobacteriales bacterium]|tara:strand:+ start:1381 stop:2325 length:945 start_codon:yes stop_codon:yes gene_type:complete